MKVNEDPELDRLRRRARVAEEKLAKALAGLELGPAITMRQREELIAELKADPSSSPSSPRPSIPAGAYC